MPKYNLEFPLHMFFFRVTTQLLLLLFKLDWANGLHNQTRTEAVEILREFTSLDGNIAEINLHVKPSVYICINLRTYIFHTRNHPHPICLPANSPRVLLTGFVATKAWLLATAVRWMIVTIELHTNEKNRFLCKVIRWQLKLLQGKINK